MSEDWEQEFYRELGARARAARQHTGLSQAEVAQELGLTRSSITNLEAGRQRPLVHQVVALAGALGVEPAALVPSRPSGADDPEAARIGRALKQARAAASLV